MQSTMEGDDDHPPVLNIVGTPVDVEARASTDTAHEDVDIEGDSGVQLEALPSNRDSDASTPSVLHLTPSRPSSAAGTPHYSAEPTPAPSPRIEFARAASASQDTLDSASLHSQLDGSPPMSDTTPQATPTTQIHGDSVQLAGAISPHPLAAFGAPSMSPPMWERVDPPDAHARDKFSSTNTRVGGRIHEFGKAPPRVPQSAYYWGPPPPDAAYGTPPIGQIGVHHPREVIRIERDYSVGEIAQFVGSWPLELEGRITPTQFLETINAINERLLAAHSLRAAALENALAFFTLQLSRAVFRGRYDTEMQKLKELIDDYNVKLYNPAGLHIRWPRKVAFLFLEIEYY